MACGCQKNNQNKVSPYVQKSQQLAVSSSTRTQLTTELLKRIEENKKRYNQGK